MSAIVEVIRSQANLCYMTGASEYDVNASEKMLGVVFTDEYREYVSAFGAVLLNGHELTGICNSPRLNVKDVTMDERSRYPHVSSEWYVIEQTNIDDIVIWQAPSGEIYQTEPGFQIRKLCDSLFEYISGNY